MNKQQAQEISDKFQELYALACKAEKEGDADAKHIAEMLYRNVRPRLLSLKGKHKING